MDVIYCRHTRTNIIILSTSLPVYLLCTIIAGTYTLQSANANTVSVFCVYKSLSLIIIANSQGKNSV